MEAKKATMLDWLARLTDGVTEGWKEAVSATLVLLTEWAQEMAGVRETQSDELWVRNLVTWLEA